MTAAELRASSCPICATPATARHPSTPYWICPSCACWFQHPAPPKVYEAAHEAPGDQMSDADKAANEALAGWLFDHVMCGTPGAALDIGSKYPYLASRLKARGCEALAIDGINELFGFGLELGVPTKRLDFEQMSLNDAEIAGAFLGTFRLITLVHCFEHLYDPALSLRKLRALVQDDGRVFIRLPDHEVRGFERDLTPGHFTIHPFFHCLSSILEALAQVRDCFVIEETYPLEPGQRDIVLRPVTKAPVIALGMIAKNEERDIVRALKSTAGAVDAAYLVDTGSTDRTREVARELAYAQTWPLGLTEELYTGASEKDATGDWRLQDFSKARNRYVEAIDAHAEWLLWLDADDELLTPREVRRAAYDFSKDVYDCWIQSGGDTWVTCRMWRTGRGIRFEGRCHEFPVLGDAKRAMLRNCLIRHDATPSAVGEDSNPRNLRILLLEWQDRPSPRCAFYLGNTHKDAGRFADAITWYNRRIEFGPGFRDEWLFAWLYRARCERAQGQLEVADCTAIIAGDLAPDWMEFVMERAEIAYQRGDHARCIELCSRAVGASIPPTMLWREVDKYTDRPLRLISWCYEHLGKTELAIEFAEKAKERIGKPDPEWDDRIARLKNASGPFISSRKQAAIALCRPGAIGDVLMTLNLIPALREANPGLAVHYFTSPAIGAHDALGGIMRAAGVDLIMDCAAWSQWAKNYERAIPLVGYPLHDSYPEKPMQHHLLDYFGAEMGVRILNHGIDLPALTLRRPNPPADLPARYITLQVQAGWSAWKEWPLNRWAAVIAALPGIPFVQIGSADCRPVCGAVASYLGSHLATSIAVVANANAHAGIDSFGQHLSNYFWTDERGGRRVPAVVLWGSTQPSAAGYLSNVNLCHQPPCGPCFRESPVISRMPRGVCVTPASPDRFYGDGLHQCMQNITIDEVVESIRSLWNES